MNVFQKTMALAAGVAISANMVWAQSFNADPNMTLRGTTPTYDLNQPTEPMGPEQPGYLMPNNQNNAGFQTTTMVPPKKNLFIYNPDYPPSRVVVYPVSPAKQTDFMKLLDLELDKGQRYDLTESLENADYRVSLSCAGATTCTKLRVYIMSPKRDVLAGYTIDKVAGAFGTKRRPLTSIAAELATTLQERIGQLEQGDYGYSHY